MTSDEGTLFDVPDDAWVIAPAPEKLTRGELAKRRIALRIINGEHPLGRGLRLHPDASRDPEDRAGAGPRCGTCRFRVQAGWPKCHWPDPATGHHVRDTGCEASDIRAWWPACADYQQRD